MNKKNIVALLLFTYNLCFSQDLISEGTNSWIFHTPDDGRTTMYVAPYTNNVWQWGVATQFLSNGNVLFTGNVGIGTIAPNAKVEIYNTAQAGHLLLSANDNPNADKTRIDIDFRVADRGHTVGRIASTYNTSENGGSGGLRFFTRNAGNLVENARLNNLGNLGLGTINPIGKFDVRGNVFIGTTDLSIGSVGSFVQIDQGASIGNTYSQIRAYSNGGNINNNLVLQSTGGNVGIGTINPTSKLTVAGDIHSREVKVTVNAGADFVFDKEYNLPTLDSVDKYIKENKHLPEIASAAEMKKDGINLSEMNIKLLQKMEEMTLYMIEQNKKLEIQQTEISTQSKEIIKLKEDNESYKTIVERISKLENQFKK